MQMFVEERDGAYVKASIYFVPLSLSLYADVKSKSLSVD